MIEFSGVESSNFYSIEAMDYLTGLISNYATEILFSELDAYGDPYSSEKTTMYFIDYVRGFRSRAAFNVEDKRVHVRFIHLLAACGYQPDWQATIDFRVFVSKSKSVYFVVRSNDGYLGRAVGGVY